MSSWAPHGVAAWATKATHVAVAKAAPTGDEFLDVMDTSFNKPAVWSEGKALIENLTSTFVSSGDPCLDFFFHVVPNTPVSSMASLLAGAWVATGPLGST